MSKQYKTLDATWFLRLNKMESHVYLPILENSELRLHLKENKVFENV